MKKLTIWTETNEFSELIVGYLLRMDILVIYSTNPKIITADVSNVSEKLLTSVVDTISKAKGENHLSIND